MNEIREKARETIVEAQRLDQSSTFWVQKNTGIYLQGRPAPGQPIRRIHGHAGRLSVQQVRAGCVGGRGGRSGAGRTLRGGMEGRNVAYGDALDAGCLCVLLGGERGRVGGGDWALGVAGCLGRRAGVVGVAVCSEHDTGAGTAQLTVSGERRSPSTAHVLPAWYLPRSHGHAIL